ncbi:MAG: radical SAM protein, partial [Candidatus Margulisiibacteriota bacterium]
MTFIDTSKLQSLLNEEKSPSLTELDQILNKSLDLKRLSLIEVAKLLKVTDSTALNKIFLTAHKIKNLIYGNRIVFFAPLYISNYCFNNCTYCAFRADNDLPRKALNEKEIQNETISLLKEGHKRILLVSGESYPEPQGLDYILNAIDTVYSVRHNNNNIRRVNVNIAPLDEPDFKRLKDHQIGTYQLFQETYHPKTYQEVHPTGQKADYEYRLTGMNRAIKSGIDDVGIGVLFGLYDYQFEVLGLMSHIEHLETTFGLGPHTISIPRLE